MPRRLKVAFALLAAALFLLALLPDPIKYVWGLVFCCFVVWLIYTAQEEGGGKAVARANLRMSIPSVSAVFIFVAVAANTGEIGLMVLKVAAPVSLLAGILIFLKMRQLIRSNKP